MNPQIGNVASGTGQIETLALSAQSLAEQSKHKEIMLDLEAQKAGRKIVVPTLVEDVRSKLRSFGEPVRLFGENPADVRSRLRLIMGRLTVTGVLRDSKVEEEGREMVEVTKVVYTKAPKSLITFRSTLTQSSLKNSSLRLLTEKSRRSKTRKRLSEKPTETDNDEFFYLTRSNVIGGIPEEEEYAKTLYSKCSSTNLETSEFVDERILTSAKYGSGGIYTSGWSGVVKYWENNDGGYVYKNTLKTEHDDRITGLDVNNNLVATASIDTTGIIHNGDTGIALKGHGKRLCKIKFHPMGTSLVTTSADRSWRLWDTETGECLCVQDGHFRECYGIGFHVDGSLCSTTDFGGVTVVWDLRTGRKIQHFQGHNKRVLCTEWSGNGFEMVTAGDDGTVKVWDLRQRKLQTTVPAHSGLISGMKYSPSSEFLATASYDGKVKLFSTRSWNVIRTLEGHTGQVTGVDVSEDEKEILSSGFDKTFKTWR